MFALALSLVALSVPGASSAAPTWLTPQDLSAPGNGGDLHIALDAAGDAFAMWDHSGVVRVAERPADGIWTQGQDISGSCSGYTQHAQVAVSPAGRAAAVWECGVDTPASSVVQAAIRPAGGDWGAPWTLSGSNAHAPQVALDPGGDVFAIWTRSNGTNFVVQAAMRRSRGVWLMPDGVSSPKLDADNPRIAVDEVGNAVAVWQTSGGAPVQAASRPAGETWGAPHDLSAPDGYAERPQVGVDSAGNAVAVWWANGIGIQASIRTPDGSWGQPENLSTSGGGALLAVNPDGDAVASWVSFDGTAGVAQVSYRPAGGSWSTPEDVSARSQDIGSPLVALDPAGDAIVAWRRLHGGVGAIGVIQAARRPAGGAWGAPQDITPPGVDADLPDVGLDAAGNGAAIWQRGDGVNWTVQAAGLDTAGPVFAGLTIAARGTARARLLFAVEPSDVWSSLSDPPHWTFGDGTRAIGVNVAHRYRRAGSYMVRLSEADDVGNETTVTRRIRIAAAPRCVVPSVVGKTLTRARAAIERRHCRTGEITHVYSATVRRGRVLAQRPAAGRRLSNGAKVSLVVSRGTLR